MPLSAAMQSRSSKIQFLGGLRKYSEVDGEIVFYNYQVHYNYNYHMHVQQCSEEKEKKNFRNLFSYRELSFVMDEMKTSRVQCW